MGFLDGFITLSESTDAMKNLKLEVLDRELAGVCIVGRRPGASAGQNYKGRLC